MSVLTERTATRVAVREIRENTWRALVAHGSSGGEAQVAARAVTWAEVHLGRGVDAALRELSHPAPGRRGVRHQRRHRSAEVLVDPAARGPLHLVPLALGLVTSSAVPVPVHLPGTDWDPALVGLLATATAASSRPALLALHLDGDGRPDAGVHLSAEGDVRLLGAVALAETASLNPALADCAGEGAGVLVASDHGGIHLPHQVETEPAVTLSVAELGRRWAQALADGVLVDGGAWQDLYAAATRFLVPEEES